MKHIKTICLLVFAALIGSTLLVGCGSNNKANPSTEADLPQLSSEKQPSQYTWEEYLAMSDEQKLAFRKSFGSDALFESWMEKAQRDPAMDEMPDFDLPWEQGGKAPKDYTWAEFEALTAAQQIAFQNSFESFEAFDSWMQEAQDQTEMDKLELPWENGGKEPSQYTWAEFESLSMELQMAFQSSFECFEAFDAWMQEAQYQAEMEKLEFHWDDGGKQPFQYTWAEFEALTAEQQIVFQNSFESFDAFDAWMQEAQDQAEMDKLELPWENGGKEPSQYTWAEFESLSVELQIAFQSSFESFEDFMSWMDRVNP